MPELRYAKNIVTDTKEYSPEVLAKIEEMMKDQPPVETRAEMLRPLWMDNSMVKGASMYMECIWLWGE